MYFHGRMTDNVRVRGENVSAMEVEQIAAKHPAVEDCAMIGVAAEIGEQEIKLFVKRRVGATLTPQPAFDPLQNPKRRERDDRRGSAQPKLATAEA